MMSEIALVNQNSLIELTADVVASYVSNNPVPAAELPGLISSIRVAFSKLTLSTPSAPDQKLVPTVSVKKSVTPDFLICLDDGKKFKSLKRHLRVHYNLTPDEYRAKWGLPHDYPMVAPAYADARSKLALAAGLGRKPAASAKPPAKAKPASKTRKAK